jgi:hypothetical protein
VVRYSEAFKLRLVEDVAIACRRLEMSAEKLKKKNAISLVEARKRRGIA